MLALSNLSSSLSELLFPRVTRITWKWTGRRAVGRFRNFFMNKYAKTNGSLKHYFIANKWTFATNVQTFWFQKYTKIALKFFAATVHPIVKYPQTFGSQLSFLKPWHLTSLRTSIQSLKQKGRKLARLGNIK